MYKQVGFIFLSFLLVSCSDANKNKKITSDSNFVLTVQSQNKIFNDELNTFGTITYNLKNDVSTQVNGTIHSFPVKEGSYVKKGQVIAQLKNVQLEIQKEQSISNLDAARASFNLAKANYSEALLGIQSRLLSIEKSELNIQQKELAYALQKKNYETQVELHKIGGITDNAIEQQKLSLDSEETNIKILKKDFEISMLGLRKEDLIQNDIEPSDDPEIFKKQIIDLNTRTSLAQLTSAQASLKTAEQQLKSVNTLINELTIKSPTDGIVGIKYYELGEYIKENEKLATIIDVSSVYAVINIQENDMINLSTDTPVFIELPSLNSKYESKISEISPIADSRSGNFNVKVTIKNTQDIIKPGMFVKCKIQKSNPAEYVCIPDTTLFSESNDSAKIFCAVNGYAVLKDIKIKHKQNGNVWIEDGLNINESVINNPSPFLRNGQLIKLING